jgi:competence protein ComEA
MMNKKKINDATAGGLLLLLLIVTPQVLFGFFVSDPPNTSHRSETMFVQISGDIRFPGVYGFCAPPDVQHLVNRAGGLVSKTKEPLTEKSGRCAGGSRIELQNDNGRLRIHKGEMQAAYKSTLGIPISLNKESAEGLTVVPGFGPRIAGAIVREREKKGEFRRLDELLSIPGIGPKLLKKASRYLAL